MVRMFTLLVLCSFLIASDAVRAQDAERGRFEKVVLDSTVTRPNELDVAPDGRVFFIEREGAVKVWDPETQSTEMAGFIPVKAIHTSGLLGLTLDPNFADNSWMYLYYSPREDDTQNVLARFTVVDNRIDPASKEVILEVPTDRYVGGGAHSGGSLAFGPDGNLFLSTGDNTNPEEVALSTPIDERPGREHWDAQRTAGNTNDLRGKILRIHPQADGSYTIPDDNLFAGDDDPKTRPEIYTMGHRNPFRIAVDPKTGWLYWGDYGPSAPGSKERGPKGYDEFNQACEAGNYGWPYFVADNKAFRNYDFATGESGRYYDPEQPVNDSPNNTGARVLPPARPALIWYPHGPSETFPELGVGGSGPMGGAVYRYDEDTVGKHGLPASYDGSFFIMEFMRGWLKEVRLEEDGSLLAIKPFLEDMTFLRPFDMDIGPDGRMYLIEWGQNYEGWFNDDAKILRLDYQGTDQRPHITDIQVEKATRVSAAPGTSAPDIAVEWPLHGGIIDWGEPVQYSLNASGSEDAAAGEEVIVEPMLMHDSHWHELATRRGKTGTFTITADSTHLFLEDAHAKLRMSVEGRDKAAGASEREIILQPRRKAAVHTHSLYGAQRIAEGVRLRENVRSFLEVKDGNYVSYAPVNLKNISSITFSVSPEAGGSMEIRADAPDGRLLGEVEVEPADEGARAYEQVTVSVSDPGGPRELYLVFRNADAGKENLMRLAWLQFNGQGMMRR